MIARNQIRLFGSAVVTPLMVNQALADAESYCALYPPTVYPIYAGSFGPLYPSFVPAMLPFPWIRPSRPNVGPGPVRPPTTLPAPMPKPAGDATSGSAPPVPTGDTMSDVKKKLIEDGVVGLVLGLTVIGAAAYAGTKAAQRGHWMPEIGMPTVTLFPSGW